MTKSDLIDLMAEKASLTKADSERALNAAIEGIQSAVANGDNVTLVGFGTFTKSERAARPGTNPSTGASISIAATTVPKFKPGAGFKSIVAKK